jgi:dihydroxyacetone kinase phosphotransfer subunit
VLEAGAITLAAHAAADATIPLKAIRGRASFLGDRSIGHMDPGARSSALMIEAVASGSGESVMESVGVVIVSHSPKVAEGAADMVRQMVGEEVPLAWTGGNPSGGLGTDVGQIMAAIDRAWSNAGVVVLVDLGGAETNSEMAIEMLPADRQGKVLICNAPVVEGAVVAATEAAGGSSVETVRQTAEEYSAR